MDILQNSAPSFQPEQCRKYFESRLSNCKFNGHAKISTNCPFHRDSTPSLSVDFDKGIWKCHAGCGQGGIFDFEQLYSQCDRETARANVGTLLGISFSSESTPEATYLYHDAQGRVAFRKLRYRTATGDKRFFCQRPSPDGEGWRSGLDGIETRPLYRLPELVRATYAIEVEGEKDADRLASLNLGRYDPDGLPVAITCNFDGAGPGKWRPEYGPYFAGKRVSIIPDNDEPGRAHAQACARGIFPFAAGVKIVTLPGLADGEDVSDYLDAGHSIEELLREIQNAPAWLEAGDTPSPSRFKSIAEIVDRSTEQPDWVVAHFVEATALTQLSAKIKMGKTTLELAACKAVLTGEKFLGQPTKRGPIVMLSEQRGSSWIAALERAGLLGHEGMSIMQWHDAFGLDWPGIVAAAVAECERTRAVLLIVDTLNQFAGLAGDDENSAGKMLETMRPLQRAMGQGFGIWYAVHERKSGGDVADAARGSSAAGGVADVLMSLRKPEGNHSETIRKISSISRFSETPDQLTIDLNMDGEYVVLGDSDAVALDRSMAAVRQALPTVEIAAKTMPVLTEETGESRTTIRRVLKTLGANRLGDGEKGNPFRYWLKESAQIEP